MDISNKMLNSQIYTEWTVISKLNDDGKRLGGRLVSPLLILLPT